MNIQGLWNIQVEAIIDIKIGDDDADSYKSEPMAELLAQWETIKKEKHGNHCRNQQRKNRSLFSHWT